MTALNVVVYAVALVLAVAAYLKGGERHIAGVIEAIKTILLVLPTLIGAFLIAGCVRVLVPEDVVREWLGEESGLKGILVGYFAGTLTFGAPSSVSQSQHRFTTQAGVLEPSPRT